MNSNSSNRDVMRDPDSAIELAPDSKHGSEGQAANGGRQVGPNSDEAGKPQAPQTGEPIGQAH